MTTIQHAITQLNQSPRGQRVLRHFADLQREMSCLDTANSMALADLFELALSGEFNGSLGEALNES